MTARNLSRSVARLAAVQALYQMEVSGATTADVISDFTAGKLPRETEATYTESEGDLELFKLLVEKAVDRQATLDRAIARHRLHHPALSRVLAGREGGLELAQRRFSSAGRATAL